MFNETVDITPERFHVRATCAETQDTNSVYILQFPFWDLVNATDYKMQKIPVGKVQFTFNKQTKPARWKTLAQEWFPKPP